MDHSMLPLITSRPSTECTGRALVKVTRDAPWTNFDLYSWLTCSTPLPHLDYWRTQAALLDKLMCSIGQQNPEWTSLAGNEETEIRDPGTFAGQL